MALSLQALKERERTEPDWIVRGLLTRGNTGFLVGPPKRSTKSWMLLDAGWSLSEGECIWGIAELSTPKKMRTVYFAAEDTVDNVHDRVLKHLERGREPNDRLWIVPKSGKIGFRGEAVRGIERELNEVQQAAGAIDLVMFDPFARLYRGNENDSEAIALVWQLMERIQEQYGCGILIAHHLRKPPLERDNYDPSNPYEMRGSGDLYGGGDAFVMCVPDKAIKNAEGKVVGRRLTTYFETKRGEPMRPAVLVTSFATGHVEYRGVGYEVERND